VRKKRSQSFGSVVTAGTARTPGGRRFVVASRTDRDMEQEGVECGLSFGLTDRVACNFRHRDPATQQPDELSSNPETRGVVETLCNSLKEAGGQKGR